MNNGKPLSLYHWINNVEYAECFGDILDLVCSRNIQSSPNFTIEVLDSDVTIKSHISKLFNSPLDPVIVSNDLELLVSFSNFKMTVSIKPASDKVREKFAWNIGFDKVVTLSLDNPPSSETSDKISSIVSAYRDCSGVSSDPNLRNRKSYFIGKQLDVSMILFADYDMISRSVATNPDTTIGKSKSGPVRYNWAIAIKEIISPFVYKMIMSCFSIIATCYQKRLDTVSSLMVFLGKLIEGKSTINSVANNHMFLNVVNHVLIIMQRPHMCKKEGCYAL